MAALYVKLAKGSDFSPVLKGLPDDLCQCPHWGYVLKGTLHLRYKDGHEEIARVGDLWYTPPGHTADLARPQRKSAAEQNSAFC
jgi:hypothetical protein